MSQPFKTLTGQQIAACLGITEQQLSGLVAAGEFAAPDVAVMDPRYVPSWAWAAATAATALASITETSLGTALQSATQAAVLATFGTWPN